ncbi:MAG: hypothetical protein ABW185_10030 [Sedimenticola sp.]
MSTSENLRSLPALSLITVLALLFFAPQASAVDLDGTALNQLESHQLTELIGNSALLLTGVAGGTLLLGISLAWILAHYRLPGGRTLSLLLMLPMAMPPFVLSYISSGPFEAIEQLFNSLPGTDSGTTHHALIKAVTTYSLTLYPYIYIPVLITLRRHASLLCDAEQFSGFSSGYYSLRFTLMNIRYPALSGLTLILLFTLSDFATQKISNLPTVTTLLLDLWQGMRQLDLLITSGLLLLLTALAITTAGHKLSGVPPLFGDYREREPNNSANRAVAITTIALSSAILLFTVIAPSLQLATWGTPPLERIAQPLLNSLTFGTMAVGITLLSLLVTLTRPKNRPTKSIGPAALLASTPPLLLAVTALFVLDQLTRLYFISTLPPSVTDPLTLLFSLATLLLAYHLQTTPQAQPQNRVLFTELQRTTTEVSAATDLSHAGVIYRYLPYLRRRALLILLLTFSFVVRELPATYLLHPTEGESIAVVCYDGVVRHSNSDVSAPALTLILLGLLTIPIVVAHYRTLFSQTLNRR